MTVVVHLAGPASVQASFSDPAGFARAHVEGTAVLLHACRDRGIDRLVYVSSAEVYGRPATSPVTEAAPMAPLSPYGAAKLGAEAMATALGKAHLAHTVVLRPFSIYGPLSPPWSVVGTISRQVAAGHRVEVFDRRPIRDYCWIGDFADAVTRACLVELAEAVAVCNIGSGTGTSVGELALAIGRAAGRNIVVEERRGGSPPRHGAVMELVADIQSAQQQLNWQPRTSLAVGLAMVVRGLMDGEGRDG